MSEKVILILVDGMTSKAVESCSHTFIQTMLENSISNLYSTTVMPSVTLPCHISLFHSVTPEYHGILTNTYIPPVNPVDGLLEQIKKSGKSSASFYNWEELRDLSRPGALTYSCCISLYRQQDSDRLITDKAIEYFQEYSPDFLFLYLGEADEKGHKFGWDSEHYLNMVYDAWSCIEKVYHSAGHTYNIIVTADHGGHDHSHGTDDPRDINIPIIINSKRAVTASDKLETANILDIAPTITALLGVKENLNWQGSSLLCSIN